MPLRCALYVLYVIGLLSACGTSNAPVNQSSAHAGDEAGAAHPPSDHRAVAIACSADRAPGNSAPSSAGASCARDTDCTEGLNGRCGHVGETDSSCSYDACVADKDCGTSSICQCGVTAGGAQRSGANVCTPSACIVDADCGAGLYCVPVPQLQGCGLSAVTFACTTPSDTCIDSRDCASTEKCRLMPELGHWACAAFMPCNG